MSAREWTVARVAGFLAGVALLAFGTLGIGVMILAEPLLYLVYPVMWLYYGFVAGGLILLWSSFPRRPSPMRSGVGTG